MIDRFVRDIHVGQNLSVATSQAENMMRCWRGDASLQILVAVIWWHSIYVFGSQISDWLRRPVLPLPVEGRCTSGQHWNISRGAQLFELLNELECLWAAAYPPASVPLGYNYGRLLAFTNTPVLNPLVNRFYQGYYTFETQCAGRNFTVSLVKMGGFSVSYGIWTINRFPIPIDPGEYYDGREAIVMDFTVDLDALCGHVAVKNASLSLSYVQHSQLVKPKGRPFRTGSWPMRLFVDLLRVVGCDSDNGTLLLGRTFMLDPDDTLHRPVFTVLYFVLKTFDERVRPVTFSCGDTITLDQNFTYSRQGAGAEFITRLNPLRYIEAYATGRLRDGLFSYTS